MLHEKIDNISDKWPSYFCDQFMCLGISSADKWMCCHRCIRCHTCHTCHAMCPSVWHWTLWRRLRWCVDNPICGCGSLMHRYQRLCQIHPRYVNNQGSHHCDKEPVKERALNQWFGAHLQRTIQPLSSANAYADSILCELVNAIVI